MPEPAYRFHDRSPATAEMRKDVLRGLKAKPKRVSPKYFYDDAGSALFEAITDLPEYYLTRTEIGLLKTYRDEMASFVGDGVCLIEYGSGSSRKIRLLLESLKPRSYVPVDISKQHLKSAARLLHEDYPWLNVYPVSADYTSEFTLPLATGDAPRVGFFPGSSIGNFEPAAAVDFIARIGRLVGCGGWLLIGVDRKKGRRALEAAYDDSEGVTARFNLNVLRHLNDAFDADFDTSTFSHVARYDEERGRIQMFLESRIDQAVRIGEAAIELDAGERIHTENSYKYTPEEFAAMVERAGFRREAWWTDERERFAIFLCRVQSVSRAPSK